MHVSTRIFTLALAIGWIHGAAAQDNFSAQGPDSDPPSRVGRVSQLAGPVSLYPAGATDWTDASTNYPVSSGDALWIDDSGRAEIQFGSSAIRLGARTSIVFGEVSDSVTQVRIDQGTLEVYVRALRPGEVYEIDTPDGTVELIDVGQYRIDVTPDGRRVTVTTRSGAATLELGDAAPSRAVRAGSSATLLGAQRQPAIGGALPADSWEQWADSLESLNAAPQTRQYVDADVVGSEDLDRYGDWRSDRIYGNVWYPRGVRVDWAPYRYGHWVSIAPWGWTWMDDSPWGFAPFHYGRWANIGGRWGWIPGTMTARPTYAPALVAFMGGADWSVSASFGGRPAVGWVPLGPQEAYIPAYRASPGYVQRANVTNVRVVVNVTQINVSNTRYVNASVPGAVTAVSRDDFTRAHPIGRNAVIVRPEEIARARPSAVPIAGVERLAPPQHTEPAPPPAGDRSGRPAVRPVAPPSGAGAPTPPPPWRGRGRDAGNGQNDPRNPPPQRQAPVTQAPPAGQPPVNPPPATPPPPQGRGRQGQPPVTPPPPPPTQTPPATQPPVTPPPVTPPPPQGRGRPGQPPVTPPPPPPANQPPAGQTPPVSSRPVPAPDRGAEHQKSANALLARQQQEDADMAKRQAQLQRNPPHGSTPEQISQLIDAERKAMASKHQKERDALEKQYGKPAG